MSLFPLISQVCLALVKLLTNQEKGKNALSWFRAKVVLEVFIKMCLDSHKNIPQYRVRELDAFPSIALQHLSVKSMGSYEKYMTN